MEIFHGDSTKVDKLNQILCARAGFPSCYDISTQTYTRKVDLRVANALSSLGATAVRIATVRVSLELAIYMCLNGFRISAIFAMTRFWMSRTVLSKLAHRPCRSSPIQ
jgi:hypothetical protein